MRRSFVEYSPSRQGEYVAQFKFTLLLLPGGTKKITGQWLCMSRQASTCSHGVDRPLRACTHVCVAGLALGQDSQIQSELTVQDEDLKKILAVRTHAPIASPNHGVPSI